MIPRDDDSGAKATEEADARASSPRDVTESAEHATAPASPSSRPLKKPKVEAKPRLTRLAHPFGVKPIGNYFEESARGIRDCRPTGLGRLVCLPDALLLGLLNFLGPTELTTLGACSRAAYVLATHDELWRTLVLEEMEGAFTPEKTWRQSYVATKTGKRALATRLQPIAVAGFYSDLLFQAFYCAAAPIEASWLAVENIPRRSARELTVEQFRNDFERPNRPVIITECINSWPAMDKWTDAYLITACEGQTFSAGGFQLPMDKYLAYSRTLVDDQPLFIFDKEFVAKVPVLGEDYDVPAYFQEDMFAWLGADRRPDHRWLIIGPEKSGSSFHIDPNSTNAWNGVIRGAKKWIMFPPEVVPPGVHPSDDGSDVSTPVSLMEWFVTFYPQVRKLPAEQRPLEGICRAGEIIFVPHGWWHLVLNTEESIAITQNFVSRGNVRSVLRFLEDKPEQVSGLPMDRRPLLGPMFREALGAHDPELLRQLDRDLAEERARRNRKSKWELLLEGPTSSSSLDPQQTQETPGGGLSPTFAPPSTASSVAPGGFSFGFSF